VRQQQKGRDFSSSSRAGGGRGGGERNNFGNDPLYALPFSISPEDALDKFRSWAYDEQGLYYLLQSRSIRIGAAYCPVWSFDVNVRFVVHDPDTGQRAFNWKPEVFQEAYGKSQSVIFLPGLAAYSGYSYRRSLVNPVHNTSLVFLGDRTVPFGQWMLRDMKLATGERLQVFPDPWNTTRGRAYAIVKEELKAIAEAESSPSHGVHVQTELVSSRRVYMPTYVVEYSVLGADYRAFVSGCDAGAAVSGDSHKVIDVSGQEAYQASTNFMTQAATAVRTGARVLGGPRIFILLQMFGGLLVRILARLPLFGLVAGVIVGFRKIVQPFVTRKWASAAWERQREHESYIDDRFDHSDEFVDSGAAQQYFRTNRGRILRHLAGEHEHEQGEFDWYKAWEQWARQQWEQQQQQQQTYERPRVRRPPPPKQPEYQWDFDPNDPYSVLGIKRGATKAEVSAAYRKEMMKYHPDTQAGASSAERLRASERAKLINDAYRKIKQEMK